jgi:uncharacterized Zn finger protein
VSVDKFTNQEKKRIVEIITENPIFLSKLLNRELPSILNAECKVAGISIFPRSWRDMNGRCSCPDIAVPCKHLAAVLYLIATEIDKNPFLVFELHGFNLFQELEKIGYTIGKQHKISIPQHTDFIKAYEFDETPFQWDEASFQSLDFSIIPNCKDQLLTLLNDKPVFFPSGNFKSTLEQAYKKVAKQVGKEAKLKNADTLTTEMDKVDEIEVILDSHFDFLTTNLRDIKGKTVLSFNTEEALIEWLAQIPMRQINLLSPALRGLF